MAVLAANPLCLSAGMNSEFFKALAPPAARKLLAARLNLWPRSLRYGENVKKS
jgi:hypothetical protein